MAKYPIFLELDSRSVVVIGGGVVALRKVQILLATGAKLLVVAEHMRDRLTDLCQNQDAKLIKSAYSIESLARKF
jgi:siroheme synthase-like protein